MRQLLRKLALVPIKFTDRYLSVLSRRWPGLAAESNDLSYQRLQSLASTVTYSRQGKSLTLSLRIPNAVCRYRAETFETKEPETLKWIDEYGGDGAFYDIGANVGLYSLYFALTQSGSVFAFEPSALNLRLLAQNISDNGLEERIAIVPVALSDKNQFASFRLSMLEEGGSMSTFGELFGHDGESLSVEMAYETLGMSLDFMLESGLISEPPALLKIDVDGIEHLILRGARNALAGTTLRSILIEVNEEFTDLRLEVQQTLRDLGFELRERRRSEIFDDGQFASSFNQIWVRMNP